MPATRRAECSRARQGGGCFRLPWVSAVDLNDRSCLHPDFHLGRQSKYQFITLKVSLSVGVGWHGLC